MIPKKALGLYTALSGSFSRFLETEVIWGYAKVKIPLYKLIYGNFSRLNLIAKALNNNKEVKKGCERLDTESQAIINEIIRSL